MPSTYVLIDAQVVNKDRVTPTTSIKNIVRVNNETTWIDEFLRWTVLH